MNNLEYLEKIKKADEDLKLDLKGIVRDEGGVKCNQYLLNIKMKGIKIKEF